MIGDFLKAVIEKIKRIFSIVFHECNEYLRLIKHSLPDEITIEIKIDMMRTLIVILIVLLINSIIVVAALFIKASIFYVLISMAFIISFVGLILYLKSAWKEKNLTGE